MVHSAKDWRPEQTCSLPPYQVHTMRIQCAELFGACLKDAQDAGDAGADECACKALDCISFGIDFDRSTYKPIDYDDITDLYQRVSIGTTVVVTR